MKLPDYKLENIKMIAVDLDGTLLKDSMHVTDRTKRAIEKAREQGILFGVCSGRSAVALKTMLKIWGIDELCDFVLGFNGGMLLEDGKVSTWLDLDRSAIKTIIEELKDEPVAFAQYRNDAMLSTKENVLTRQMANRNRLKFETVKKEQLYMPSGKLMIVGMPWTIAKILKKNQNRFPDARMFQSGPFLIEVVNPKLSKLEGIRRIGEKHGFDNDQILTFGNDNNDLEMLEGTEGVAMKNALKAVKEKAKWITDSNTKDGVAKFIESCVLNEPDLKGQEQSI